MGRHTLTTSAVPSGFALMTATSFSRADRLVVRRVAAPVGQCLGDHPVLGPAPGVVLDVVIALGDGVGDRPGPDLITG